MLRNDRLTEIEFDDLKFWLEAVIEDRFDHVCLRRFDK